MFMDFAVAENSRICSQPLCEFNAFGLQVCSDDETALEAHQLRDQLANESESDHRDLFT